jgi:hypothetical protein
MSAGIFRLRGGDLVAMREQAYDTEDVMPEIARVLHVIWNLPATQSFDPSVKSSAGALTTWFGLGGVMPAAPSPA